MNRPIVCKLCIREKEESNKNDKFHGFFHFNIFLCFQRRIKVTLGDYLEPKATFRKLFNKLKMSVLAALILGFFGLPFKKWVNPI